MRPVLRSQYWAMMLALPLLSSCAEARDFELSREPYDISLEALANFSPEGVGEEVRVRADIHLEGETLVLTGDDRIVRLDVSETLPDVLECVSQNEVAADPISLYFSPQIDGAVITLLLVPFEDDPSDLEIVCADIIANNVLARNSAVWREQQ